MLDVILGNKSAEKAMLALFYEGELHASAIAKNYKTAIDPIKKQLEKFEDAGILKSRIIGRSKLYSFDDSHPLTVPLKELINSHNLNNERNKNEE